MEGKFKIEGSILVEYYDNPEIAHIIIPNNVTSIGTYAFRGCRSLTSITIPDSVTSIGNNAFSWCTNLTSVTIPDSVTSIGNYVFSWCTNLTSVTIPDSVTSIGNYVFFECTNLTSVTIPDSVTSIGNSAFRGCKNLKSKRAYYKAFNITEQGLMCRDDVFELNKWAKDKKHPKLCENGYHFCDNLFNIFNYYHGKIDKDIAIYECEVGDIVIADENNEKYVTNKIKLVKGLDRLEVIKILNNK